ncbi:MAG: hypothetical protein MJ108_09565 [Saccharofermentans sp.]|nr:hypothetical protein [Saccharofermentans sp.]
MKYVIVLLSELSKLELGGIEKLTKSDHLALVYVKGKKTIPAACKETMDEVKAVIDYVEVASASDSMMQVAYLMGYHAAAKHDVFVVLKDKTKVPTKLVGDAHVYTSFKSIAGASATKTTAKKTTAAKTTAAKTTTKKTTAAKSTTKKTTTKKTTTSKKKKETTVADVIGSWASGDKKKAQEGLADIAGQLLGTKK